MSTTREDQLSARVLALEDELDVMRERLKQAAGGDESPMPFAARFGLTKHVAILLNILMKHEYLPKERLFLRMYSDRPDPPDPGVMDVWIHKLRQSMKPYGVHVDTIYQQGVSISAFDKQKVRDYLTDMEAT